MGIYNGLMVEILVDSQLLLEFRMNLNEGL